MEEMISRRNPETPVRSAISPEARRKPSSIAAEFAATLRPGDVGPAHRRSRRETVFGGKCAAALGVREGYQPHFTPSTIPGQIPPVSHGPVTVEQRAGDSRHRGGGILLRRMASAGGMGGKTGRSAPARRHTGHHPPMWTVAAARVINERPSSNEGNRKEEHKWRGGESLFRSAATKPPYRSPGGTGHQGCQRRGETMCYSAGRQGHQITVPTSRPRGVRPGGVRGRTPESGTLAVLIWVVPAHGHDRGICCGQASGRGNHPPSPRGSSSWASLSSFSNFWTRRFPAGRSFYPRITP